MDKSSLFQKTWTVPVGNFLVANFFAFLKGYGFIIKFGVVLLPKFARNHSKYWQKYITKKWLKICFYTEIPVNPFNFVEKYHDSCILLNQPLFWILIHWIHIQIRIRHFMHNYGSGSGSRVLTTKIVKKEPAGKKIFFKSKTAIYLSLGPLKGHLSNRRNLQPSKENIQHWEFINIFYFHVIFHTVSLSHASRSLSWGHFLSFFYCFGPTSPYCIEGGGGGGGEWKPNKIIK